MENQNQNSGRRHRENSASTSSSSRRSLKRKLDEEFGDDRGRIGGESPPDSHQDLVREVRTQVEILDSAFSSNEQDRASAKRAIHVLSELAKNEDIVNVIVDCAAVPVLVKHLQAPPPVREGESGPRPYEHEVEKGSAFTLGLLAIKPEHQQLIVDAGALPHLVDLLKRHSYSPHSRAVNGVIRRAADAITNLAHENSSIKTRVRIEGGIPPLVELLEFADPKVQRAAAGALRTLAFKNDENKNQIVECNALPTLILMLRSEDAAIHYEAVGVIGNLVHSSPNIKKEVLAAGALQPVIGLLSSCCSESQREAALLLGQFAATDSDCKVHIVQRGAVPPLIEMLQSPDAQLKEMSAFALGRLAQDTHNQAGIAHSGGIVPLLKLLESKNGSLQHNAAFALYGLADNEDNVADLIRVGGVQKLQDGEFIVQPTRDCVAKTLKRLEEKIHGRVLSHLLYMMRVGEKNVQRRVALALAHLCSPDDQRTIFIDNNGLGLLLELLESTNPKHQRESSMALCSHVLNSLLVNAVYLGEQYVNNPTLSDVTFLVEGKRFYAHRICLLASSDAFRAMFDGGYRERDAKDIEIPNIRWDVFELMMRYIYTGSVDVNLDIAQDLLRAADQYLLEGLKRLCEYTIAQDISAENVSLMFELSEAFNALSLRHACILFTLEKFDKLCIMPWYPQLIQRILPETRNYFVRMLTRPIHAELRRSNKYFYDQITLICLHALMHIVGGKNLGWNGLESSKLGSTSDIGNEEFDWVELEADLYHWTKVLRPVQWYPGHIAKTEKELKDQLKLMDVVIEVRDARIPMSTSHPQMDSWLGNRKRIIVLNREDMISTADRNAWASYYARQGTKVVFSNGQLGMGTMKLNRRLAEVNYHVLQLVDMFAVYRPSLPYIYFKEKLVHQSNSLDSVGRRGKVRAGIVGYPNVGKSSLINRWVRFGKDLELLDSPGIIPMRINDQSAAIKLAICDDIGERSYDVTEVAAILVQMLARLPAAGNKALRDRYKIETDGRVGKIFVQKLALQLFNGDTHQAAFRILSDFRKGKFGWVALERPPRATDELIFEGKAYEYELTGPHSVEEMHILYHLQGPISEMDNLHYYCGCIQVIAVSVYKI
ncbi:UNVERIFIED_CONTAM: arm repeat protein interacting with a [Sesamum calycinum]|uniref:Arm repeat protein interacting with a n=1 Tax=Sesamum calycinum TaxID=2727403 RepID=A0AAW2SFW0_9LAMI